MTRAEIDDVVCGILMNDGPDGHVDGHEVITDFIVACLRGTGQVWATQYVRRLEGEAIPDINSAS